MDRTYVEEQALIQNALHKLKLSFSTCQQRIKDNEIFFLDIMPPAYARIMFNFYKINTSLPFNPSSYEMDKSLVYKLILIGNKWFEEHCRQFKANKRLKC